MTLYVDDLLHYEGEGIKGGDWCHLWSDNGKDELNAFALNLGLYLKWIQHSRGAIIKDFWHYDLRPNKRRMAIQKGAVELPLIDFIAMVRDGKVRWDK